MDAHAPNPEPRDEPRRGFTLVEVLIAIIMLAVGVLAMAGTTGYITRQITLANALTERQAAVQSIMEGVRAQAWADVGSGSATNGNFSSTWTSVQSGQVKTVTIITTGPGMMSSGTAYLSNAVVDTFVFTVLNP